MFQWAEMSNTAAENGAAENSETLDDEIQVDEFIYLYIEYTNLDLKTCFVCCVFCFHIPKVTTRSRPPEERSYWKKHGCTDILKLFWKGDKNTTSKHIRTEIDSVFQWHWKRDLQVVQHLCQFPSFRLGALAEWMVDSYSIHFFYTPKRS